MSDPTGNGLSSTRLPPPTPASDASQELSLSLVLLTDQLWLGGSRDPISGSVNLLEQVTEFREILTYIKQFIKGYYKGYR